MAGEYGIEATLSIDGGEDLKIFAMMHHQGCIELRLRNGLAGGSRYVQLNYITLTRCEQINNHVFMTAPLHPNMKFLNEYPDTFKLTFKSAELAVAFKNEVLTRLGHNIHPLFRNEMQLPMLHPAQAVDWTVKNPTRAIFRRHVTELRRRR